MIANVTITAIADYDETWKGWQPSLNPTIWVFSPDRLKIPEQIAQDRVKATPRSMSINLTLQSYEKIIISNMFTPPYSELVQELKDLAGAYPTFLKLTEIGLSPMGNSNIFNSGQSSGTKLIIYLKSLLEGHHNQMNLETMPLLPFFKDFWIWGQISGMILPLNSHWNLFSFKIQMAWC